MSSQLSNLSQLAACYYFRAVNKLIPQNELLSQEDWKRKTRRPLLSKIFRPGKQEVQDIYDWDIVVERENAKGDKIGSVKIFISSKQDDLAVMLA